MKNLTLIFSILCGLSSAYAQSAPQDFLEKVAIQFEAEDPLRTLSQLIDNPQAIFFLFQPRLDSGSKLVSGPQVGGTRNQPTLKLSIRKCVFIFCQTVELDAEAQIEELSEGTCDRNLLVRANLSRSSELISNNFRELQIQACVQLSEKVATVDLEFSVLRADSYPSGLGIQEVLKMLKLQVQPLSQAFQSALNMKIEPRN